MRQATILVAILAFTPLASATAQVRQPPVQRGTRVRVTIPPICPPDTICVGHSSRHVVGRFVTWKADSLVMESNGDRLALPTGSVIRLEVRGRGSWGAGNGAFVGFWGGGLLGVLVSSRNCSTGGTAFTLTREQCIGVSTVGGAIVGTLVGLVVGTVIMTDRWEEVPLDRLRVSFGPQRDGRFGIGASVRF